MRIERRFTKDGQSPYADIEFRLTTSEIRNPDGSVVFHADNVEVPTFWSQVAADVLAQKYFRKAGVPARLKKVEEETIPSWLWRSTPDVEALQALPEKERSIGEESGKQVFERLAGTWTYGAELAAMVQHRPALGLWHRRAEPGSFLRRLRHRQAGEIAVGLRASAAARLLHPVDRRRSRQ